MKRATWLCAACGESASSVYVLDPGEPDPRPAHSDHAPEPSDFLIDSHRISIHGGPVSVAIGLAHDQVDAVKAALERFDAAALFKNDREHAPFWCPDCAQPYCGEHYEHWDVYDGPFFDSIRGRCPNGHERMLMD